MPGLEQTGIALGVLLLVALPTALHGWPTTLQGNLFTGLVLAGGLALMWWRSHPRAASVLALGLFMAALAVGDLGWFPDTGMALFSLAFAVLALGWSGRAAWLVALCALAYLVPFYYLADMGSAVAAAMFTVPPFAVATVLRLRKQAADELALRAQELEEERELFAEIAHLAFRVVQESLTNALRYAPGADVRIVISLDETGRCLAVHVENDPVAQRNATVAGTGRGLIGLRERTQALSGQFHAGTTAAGGWAVEARLPQA